MGDASNVQTSFLSGEWSPYAQGRLDDPEYKRGMNVCRNAYPVETGAWSRRSGLRFQEFTRNGQRGKLTNFSFSQGAPYTMEFTDGKLRFRDSFGLVNSEEPRGVLSISQSTPAVLTTTNACPGPTDWAQGDQVHFNFITGRASVASGALIDGQYLLIAGNNQEQWLLYDAISGQPLNGATVQWDETLDVQVARIFEIDTPYTNGSWANIRAVQDEDSILILHPKIRPYSIFAPIDGGNLFTFNPAQFIDGPYLPPPTDGSFLTSSALTGAVTIDLSYPAWSNTQAYPDGSRFFAATQKRAGLTSTSVQYTAGAVVMYTGNYYVSIQDDNVNHTPTDTAWWTLIQAGSIISPTGFQSTDVGRLMRLNSEPDLWVKATDYTADELVTYQGAYYTALVANTGNIPGADAVNWGVASNASQWTWGIITAVNNVIEVVLSIQGPDLLYANNIRTYRIGTYSDSTSWPSCGTFHEDRFWLAGAVKNGFDSSKSDGNTYDFTPTSPDGTVSDDNGISEILASPTANLIQWLVPDHQGLILGTLAGEWLLQSSNNNDPITPTSIQAHNVTKYGSANVEPRRMGVSLAFVHRQGQKAIEYVCDLFSSKFAGMNLSEKARHLTTAGITVLAYQQEITPILWARTADSKLIGTTYKRESMMISQPPNFNGWHRHDLGSGYNVLDIVEGPSPDGLSDTVTLLTEDPVSGICQVEAMMPTFQETDTAIDAWFVDKGVVPSGGFATNVSGVNGVLLSGLRALNGATVSAYIAGLDCGDYLVTAGQIFVPFASDPDKQFTLALLQAFQTTGATQGFQIVYANPNFNQQTMLEFPPIATSVLDHYTYLNYGAQAFPDWERDRVTFMLPGTGPDAGFIQYVISTGAFIQYRNSSYIWGANNPPYYDNTLTYHGAESVTTPDGAVWNLVVPGSVGINPLTPGQHDWMQMFASGALAAYNAGTTYAANAYVSYAGTLYLSLMNGNVGNTPNTHPLDWFPVFVLTPWSATTAYTGGDQLTGDDDEIFWAIGNVPAGLGDPNSFTRNNNPYWQTAGAIWPIGRVTQDGFGLDFNGDFFMYQADHVPNYIKIDGTTLKVKGFATAAPSQSVPTPSNYCVPIRATDNDNNATADFILETVDTDPAGTTHPSAVLMSVNGFEATQTGTFVFDEGNSPIACSGKVGVGVGSAFVLTRPKSGPATAASVGLYALDVQSQSNGGPYRLLEPAIWVDPNAPIESMYSSYLYGQNQRKCGLVAPADIDPTWTFFTSFTGLLFDHQDGNVMTFVGTQNPTVWDNTQTFELDGNNLLSYTLGSDGNIYRFVSPPTFSLTTTYALNAVVGDGHTNGETMYVSLSNGNIGHALTDGTHWAVFTKDPTTDTGHVYWTLVRAAAGANQLYFVKLSTDCAKVIWAVPVNTVPAPDIGFPFVNISNGYYVFLEGNGIGAVQVRRINTLTGFSVIQYPGQDGIISLGGIQVYNDATGDIMIFPQYDADAAVDGTAPPLPVNPVGGTTSRAFTGWGRWNVQPPFFDYLVPGVVGFTYTSQGQLLRPVAPQETGARNGPAFGKTKRYHRYAMSVANTGAIQVGTDFAGVGNNVMRPAKFKSRAGKGALLSSSAFLYTGEHSDTVDDDYNLDGMLAWQVIRPVSGVILAIGGMLQTQDR